jgi:hypothetical protein
VPTVAVAGKPDKSGNMSAPVTASVVIAVLLVAFGSFDAPVVPVSVDVPTVVGVPETVQVIEPPAATVTGVAGEHNAVRPAGSVAMAQVAAVAATAGDAALVHV